MLTSQPLVQVADSSLVELTLVIFCDVLILVDLCSNIAARPFLLIKDAINVTLGEITRPFPF